MPTKEQERQALAKIEKILAGLGNNPETSYVCRAFQGCIQDAHENIDFDFANSQKDRADDLEKKLNEAKQEAQEAREALEAMQARTIDTTTRDKIYNFINYELSSAKCDARNAAAEMLEACEDPSSDEYQKALSKAQAAKRRAARLEEMLDGLRNNDR